MSQLRGDILVDMDGVAVNFDASVEAELKLLGVPTIQPRSNFYIHRDYPKDTQDLIKGIWRASGFYRKPTPIDGIIEGWQAIADAGFRPRICSSPIKQNPDCVAEKQDWLEEFLVPALGCAVIDLAIFTRDKSGQDAIALIDDAPEVKNAAASYNQQAITDLRLRGWHDDALPSLLDAAANRYISHIAN